ncbi:MAG: DUF3419 family protein, partial [Planctomycetota bacterium]
GAMPELFRERVRKLGVDFDMDDNYFAWQAFGRRYDHENKKAIPDYLREENFKALRERLPKVETHIVSLTKFLGEQPDNALDRFVLLDSQDWMPDEVIAELWSHFERVGDAGTRVIFRTSGSESPIERALPPDQLAKWEYRAEESAEGFKKDRSAIYGGFHLYVKK